MDREGWVANRFKSHMATIIGSAGDSASTNKQRNSALRFVKLFSAHERESAQRESREPRYNVETFEELDEATLTDRLFYELFATSLVHDYAIGAGRKNSGQALALGSVINSLRLVVNLANARLKPGRWSDTRLSYFLLASIQLHTRTPAGGSKASSTTSLGQSSSASRRLDASRASRARRFTDPTSWL